MKILFICKWNRFRSKVAEYFFNRLSKKNKAISLGLIETNVPLRPGEKERRNYLKEKFGINLTEKTKGVNVKDLEKADKIIIVANDVDPKIFDHWRFKNKVETWKIKDESGSNTQNIDEIVNQIKSKVEKLVKNLEVKK